MKKVLILTVAMILVLSGMAFAGVVGSKHDMTTNGTSIFANGTISGSNTSGTTSQVCIFCHHPHKTGVGVTKAKALWNRNDPTGPYDLYDAPKGTEGTGGVLGGDGTDAHYSRICLSCHDSNEAVNVVSRTPPGISGGATISSIGADSQANIGGDANTLQNDHPVDMDYTSIQAAYTADFNATSATDVVADIWKLYNGTVQCATCHDPHNDTPTDGVQFIRGDGTELVLSKMCTDCHIR